MHCIQRYRPNVSKKIPILKIIPRTSLQNFTSAYNAPDTGVVKTIQLPVRIHLNGRIGVDDDVSFLLALPYRNPAKIARSAGGRKERKELYL
jgi:hypothetical protein